MKDQSIDLFVPGRLCLFGEHSDWAGGYRRINSEIIPGSAVVIGTEEGIRAKVKRSGKLMVRSVNPDGTRTDTFVSDMDLKMLKRIAAEGSFFSYIAGVAAYIYEHYVVDGLEIDCYEMTLPMAKGLSSSAAICVLAARAFNQLYNLQLTTRGEMEIAYKGEIMTPSRCGKMDQGCAYGKKPIHMVFDGDNLDINVINVGKELYWVLANLNSKKDTKRILSDLNSCYPFPRNEMHEEVQSALGTENQQLVVDVIKAMEKGDARKIGKLMDEAQQLFDKKVAPACPNELTAPKLHKILEDEYVRELAWGGKGIGSQGDGSVQFIVKGEAEQEELVRYLNEKCGLQAFKLTVPKHKKVTKAVIPVAGFGTRLFPATKVIKKELFPVLDQDGIMKPALLILIEELVSSGIEEICLIIQEEEELYRKLFSCKISDTHMEKLPSAMREYEKRICDMGEKITYAVQKGQEGFGHAVFQSYGFSNSEPVLLLLGDHIYKSCTGVPCAKQIIDAYEHYEQLTIMVEEVPVHEVGRYGMVSGKWMDSVERVMNVTKVFEKPTKDYAEEFMGVKMQNGTQKYYSVFGQYILTPSVFQLLGRNIAENKRERGEFQLTSVLEEVRSTEGMVALVPSGKRYDIGMPDSYQATVAAFSNPIENER
jgi:UTP-glucose-1-phosphate uridylyltransferase/galactokinase